MSAGVSGKQDDIARRPTRSYGDDPKPRKEPTIIETPKQQTMRVRVLLPGERAWGEVIEGIDADTMKVRIDNHVGADNQHAYRMNDEVVVVRDGEAWLVIGRAKP